MPVERRTEGVGLALWWTRQRDRNYLRKRGGGRPLGPGTEGPRVEPVKPEGRRSSPSGGENRKERPCTRLERASSDSNRRILKTVRPVVWEGAGAQSPALDPIQLLPNMTNVAAVGSLVGRVAIHAEGHGGGLLLNQYLPLGHRSVAGGAFNLGVHGVQRM